MKKGLLFIIMFSIYLSGAAQGECWSWGKKEGAAAKTSKETSVESSAGKETAPEAAAPAADLEAKPAAAPAKAAKSEKDLQKAKALREKKRNELNNTQWDVEMTPLSGKGEKRQDILIFQDHKFSSDEFSLLGFKGSNYTLSLEENGNVVVETMQSSETEGMIFWRLEFDSPLAFCKGVLSRQLANNKTEDYSFISTTKKPFVPAPPAAVSAPATAAPETSEPKAGKK